MPDPKVFGFDAQSVRKLSEVVKRVLNESLAADQRFYPARGAPRAFHLARASAFVAYDATGSFVIRRAAGAKGDETASDDTVTAYVRRGCCLKDIDYILVEICAGSDATLEVLNPTTIVRGKTASDVSAGSSATLNIYTGAFGSEAQPSGTPSIASVRNDSSCTVKGSQIATAGWLDDNSGWQFLLGKTS